MKKAERLKQTEETEKEISKLGAANKGYRHERILHPASEMEKQFYQHWKKENTKNPRLGFGQGILQDLFSIQGGNPISLFNLKGWKIVITKREKYIVATVIQWLGTNCGRCFLEEVLKDSGYKITPIKKQE